MGRAPGIGMSEELEMTHPATQTTVAVVPIKRTCVTGPLLTEGAFIGDV